MLDYVIQTVDYIHQYWQVERIDPRFLEDLFCIFKPIQVKALSKELPLKTAYLLSLPVLCYQAAGGDPEDALAINAVWMLYYAAFDLLDKVEDGEIESLAIEIRDQPTLINLTTGLLFSAASILINTHLFPNHSESCEKTVITTGWDFKYVQGSIWI